MKIRNIFNLFLLLLVFNDCTSQVLKVMTYNIRLDLKSDGINAWSQRKPFFTAQLQFYEPDIFGIQEALPNQVAGIASALPEYMHVGVGRDGNNTGEASDIFFKKQRFKMINSGTFWLSETPDVVSKGWDAAYNRICTYARLWDKKTNKQFWVFNTHLDNEGKVARIKEIELILSRMKTINKMHLPVIFTGDFNSESSTPQIQFLKTKMIDTHDVSAQRPFGPSGTFNGFHHDEPVTMLIDYIFLSRNTYWIVNKYAVLSDSKDLRYPSDHLPVYVELRYKKQE